MFDLEAAMQQCASAQQGAAACLSLNTGSGVAVHQAQADGVGPMDVVAEGAVGAGAATGDGGVGARKEGSAANGSVGFVGQGSGVPVAGKGKLPTVFEGEREDGR